MEPRQLAGDRVIRGASGLAAALALLLGACGGGARSTPAAPARAAAPAPDPCQRYMRAVGGFLMRFEVALEEYQGDRQSEQPRTSRAEAARTMADFVDTELPDLRTIRAPLPRLEAAHGELVGALAQLVGALEQLSTAYVLDDRRLRIRALERVDEAWRRWSEAGLFIHGMCRESEASRAAAATG